MPKPGGDPSPGRLAMMGRLILGQCWLGAPGMAISHFATIFFAGSRFASHGGRLRNDLDPTLRRLRAPIRATQTSARYGRGESSREMERVRHDPLHFFREIGVSGLLFHLASLSWPAENSH